MRVRSLVFAAVMAVLLTTAAHAQLLQELLQVWKICEGYMANPTSEQQIKACTEIIESGRETPERLAIAYFWRGHAWRYQDNLQRAIADFTEAIRLNPKYFAAYGWRGQLLGDTGDYDGAVANYTDAIKVFPDDDWLIGCRGFAHFYRGDFPASADDLRRAIQLHRGASDNEDRAPMLYLVLARVGQDGSADLQAEVDVLNQLNYKVPNYKIPLIFDLFLGRSSPEAMLAAVDSRRSQCRTDFYIGEWHLIHNNRDEARRRLQLASAKQCDFIHPTYQGAVAELKRMIP